MLSSLEHHELLVFWAQLLVIYVTARAMGKVARRAGLPAVVGELFAGVLLGPSIFGWLWPSGFNWFLPDSEVQSSLLLAVGWLSAAFLLVVAGFETDLKLIRRLGRAAVLVTMGSMLVPMIGGIIVGSQMPDTFYGENGTQRLFMLFIGVSLSVSALAVIAKVLGDLGLMRRDVGQLTVAVGMANDLIGWVILGVLSGLAVSGKVSLVEIASSVGGLALFLVLAMTVGQRAVDAALRTARRHGPHRRDALTISLGAMLLFGVITQWLGVEAVLGAFVAGVVLNRSRYQQADSAHVIEDLTAVIFAPLFFATAGLRLDLGLLRGSALVWSVVLLVTALVLKFVGSYAGARFSGLTRQEGYVLGAGLNARGALEIIIATVGLSLGILNQTSFTMIVLIPLVTSLIASIGVRYFVRDLKGSVAERERLAREKAMASNLVVRSGRLLLPSRGRLDATVASQLVDGAWPDEFPATVLAMQERDGTRPDLSGMAEVLKDREFEIVDVTRDMWVERVLEESRLGYAVAAVGMSHTATQDMLNGDRDFFFSPLVDRVLNQMQIPVVLVKRSISSTAEPFERALIPLNGATASRGALELAAGLSAHDGVELVLSNIVSRVREPASLGAGVRELVREARDSAPAADLRLSNRMLDDAADKARGLRATVRTEIRFATDLAEDVVSHATEENIDLIILGADLRRINGRPSLGGLVEFVLKNASQTVAVVVMPPQSGSSAH